MKVNSKVMIVVSIWMYRYVQCIASALIASIVFQFRMRKKYYVYLFGFDSCLS